MRFSDLTDYQKSIICNGCGGKGGFIKPPSCRFKAQCDQHDFYYWRGGTEIDRYNADLEFYLMMLSDARRASKMFKWGSYSIFIIKLLTGLIRHLIYAFYRTWAWLYFRAVRSFGYSFFSYGDKKTEGDLP